MDKGQKRQCVECSCLFYDLGKEEASCPKCLTLQKPRTYEQSAEEEAPDQRPRAALDSSASADASPTFPEDDLLDQETFQGEFLEDPLYLLEDFEEESIQ